MRICKALLIDPSKARVLSFEYGVNLHILQNVQDVIDNRLLTYSTKELISYLPSAGMKSLGKTAKLIQYVAKCYNKGPQYGILEHLLRFELRFRKMRAVNKPPYNIATIADFLDVKNLRALSSLLLMAWSKVLLCDPQLPIDLVPAQYKDLMIRGQNPRYWINLLATNRKSYYKLKASFIKLTKTYGKDDVHSEIMELIKREINELLK